MEFVTYAACIDDVALALEVGADHLILEDSKLAVRSYAEDYKTHGFEKYKALAEHARSINPQVKLSVNIDKLLHDRHHPLLEQVAPFIVAAGIKRVRVQDPGVAVLLSRFGDFEFHLTTETGNNNISGMTYYEQNQMLRFVGQTLSNDWEIESIKSARNALPHSCLEFQAHGPVLLQYTDRRLMAGHNAVPSADAETEDPIRQRMADVEGRSYPLHDNPHGHFMYASFDKALYNYIPQLLECEFDAWLFDGRGEEPEYVAAALRTYRQALEQGVDAAVYDELKSIARRPLKPGFFLVNNTDYVFESDAQDHKDKRILAKVVDSVKRKSLVIEAVEDMRPGTYAVRTPEGKEKTIFVKEFQSLSGETQLTGEAGKLWRIHWAKGLYADCEFLEFIAAPD